MPPRPRARLRLTRIRTYMGAVGTDFVGFRLRAKLIEQGQAREHPSQWSTPDVENFPARQGVTERLMDTQQHLRGRWTRALQWDIQVEYRFDRSGGRP